MVYVIIPVFNRIHYTIACLESLHRQTVSAMHIIVVDDGSSDGTGEAIRERFPAVTLLRGDGALWWAGAMNKGVQCALTASGRPADDFVLSLNNDLIVGNDYVASLLACQQQHAPCLVGSVSVDINSPETIDYIGVRWNRFTARYRRLVQSGTQSYTELRTIRDSLPSDLLPGRGTLIPLALFTEIGLFDHVRFPQYAADEDFSYRAKRAGYALIVSVKGVVLSHCQATGLQLAGKRFTYRTLWQSMTSRRSPTNVTVRFNWAMKNTELKLIYFLLDHLRILTSFHLRMLRQVMK